MFTTFQAFVKYVTNHFHANIKIIRTDNDTEFFNHQFSHFLSSLEIQHQSSCPYTPQQNARVERKHKHLLEMTRSLRFQSGLLAKYWGECLLTATHLINLLPTPVLQFKSPYELLFHQKPDYTTLRAFGCLCYAMFIHQIN